MNHGDDVSRRPWPTLRNAVESVLNQHRPHTYFAFGEVDVTDALVRIRKLQREVRCAVSFHAYLIHALAHAASEHPDVLTFRHGKQLITFKDVDLATTIDKRFGRVRLPAVYTVRAAQTKDLAEINWELRQGIREDQGHTESVRLRRRMTRMPGLVRRLIGWWMSRNPFVLKRYHGNLGLTSLNSQGLHMPFYALPPNLYTVTMAAGSLFERRVVNETGQVETRNILCLSGGADHMVIDGMPISRFTVRLMEMLESCYGLDESFVEKTRTLMQQDEARETNG